MVDYAFAKTQASNHTEYRRATKEEKILLMNAQRFLMALPYKNKWEIENQQLTKEKKKISALNNSIKEEMTKLKKEYDNLEHGKEELQQELAKAKSELDYAWNKLVGDSKANIEHADGCVERGADRCVDARNIQHKAFVQDSCTQTPECRGSCLQKYRIGHRFRKLLTESNVD